MRSYGRSPAMIESCPPPAPTMTSGEQARVIEEPEEEKPEEPEEPVDEEVEQPGEPEKPLASTGSDVVFAVVMALMALASGILILVMAHRRESL